MTLAVTPGHRECDLVSTLARLARPFVTETNVSPVFFDQIQTQVDLDASRPSAQRHESISRSPTVTLAA